MLVGAGNSATSQPDPVEHYPVIPCITTPLAAASEMSEKNQPGYLKSVLGHNNLLKIYVSVDH